jgi:type III secretory pathway component EscS
MNTLLKLMLAVILAPLALAALVGILLAFGILAHSF